MTDEEALKEAQLESEQRGTPVGLAFFRKRFGFGELRSVPLHRQIMEDWTQRPPEEEHIPGAPASTQPILSIYPSIPANILVLSDLHVPLQDKDWLEYAVRVAVTKQVPRLLLAGDVLDAKHLGKFVSPPDYPFEHEIEVGAKVISWLKDFFGEIYIIPGNHEYRFTRKLDGQLLPSSLLRMLGLGTTVYDHHHVFVGESWLVAHPKNYSRLPGKPALELAAKFEKSVMVAHTHKWALSRDVSGRHWIAEAGMCADPNRVGYLHEELTTMPLPQQGAFIITGDERPIPLHPDL